MVFIFIRILIGGFLLFFIFLPTRFYSSTSNAMYVNRCHPFQSHWTKISLLRTFFTTNYTAELTDSDSKNGPKT